MRIDRLLRYLGRAFQKQRETESQSEREPERETERQRERERERQRGSDPCNKCDTKQKEFIGVEMSCSR